MVALLGIATMLAPGVAVADDAPPPPGDSSGTTADTANNNAAAPADAKTPQLTASPASSPAPGEGARLVEPAAGAHVDHLTTAPMVQFDPGIDKAGKQETPRWVLLATDAEMQSTIRYCRNFVWAVSGQSATSTGTFHWGCNQWSAGTNQLGQDQLQPLEPGRAYFWQVVSKSNTEGAPDVLSRVRVFYIDKDDTESIEEISNRIMGTAVDDGTYLNLGAAAYVNSKVRVKTIKSQRLGRWTFRIRGTHLGGVDHSRSYVVVKSAAGRHVLGQAL